MSLNKIKADRKLKRCQTLQRGMQIKAETMHTCDPVTPKKLPYNKTKSIGSTLHKFLLITQHKMLFINTCEAKKG